MAKQREFDFMGNTKKKATKTAKATTTEKRKYTRRTTKTGGLTVSFALPKDPARAYQLGLLAAQYTQ